MVSAIVFTPRANFASRMIGGRFEGSNESSVSGYETLHTILERPAPGSQRIELTGSAAYRYYRYVSPNRGFGNMAELSFEFSEVVEVLEPSEAVKDQLPDDWELLHFGGLDVTYAGEDEDFDGDGATNLDELVAGQAPPTQMIF